MNFFDPILHRYTIAGRPVPSVTQVIREILGDATWSATQWHMDRGTAIHACMALLAKGKCFNYDTAIDGQVTAGRKFFAEMKPEVLSVEQPIYCLRYNFAGTLDLWCRIGGKEFILDWKSAVCEMGEVQIGGYAIERPTAKWGMVVALKEDGTYRAGAPFKLDRARQEFLAVLTVYNIRRRWKLTDIEEGDDGN